MADRLIAKTPEGDRLYQTGASLTPNSVGDFTMDDRTFALDDQPLFAFGYVKYANGREFLVPDLNAFLARGFFEQVNPIDETLTD